MRQSIEKVGTKYSTLAKEREHQRRLGLKRERVAGLKALLTMHEAAGNVDEAKGLVRRVRLAEQELRYMES
jgi:hypothetical protein